MKRKVLVWTLCVLAVIGMLFAIPAFAADEGQTYTTVATADELLAALEGGYAYVRLGAGMDVELSGQTLVVDLAGYDLNVSGSGKVKAFDTANDTFDHTLCGTLTCEDSVTCATTFTAPTGDAFFYVGYGGSGRYTFHRMDMKITNVVFRPSAAGVYYKAYFACDRLMEESVKCYGVAARTGDTVPGKNFRSNAKTYTENTGLISGTTVNSGIIADILRDVTAEENKASADTVINARLYIELDGQGIVMAPTYAATSLNSLLAKLDSGYSKLAVTVQNQLDDFHDQWANKTTGWNFENIGAADLDFDAMNANLIFDEGTTEAMCYKCGKKVTWTAVSDESALSGTNGSHYYLADDLEYTGSTSSFIDTGSGTSCLHLNGHNITSTNTKYVFWIGSGRMNVMGQGIVTGESKDKETGAAIHGNNKNASNGIYLYGGTYTKTADSTSSAPIIGVGVNGRNVNIYEQATVDGGTGTAIYFDGSSSSRAKEGYLGLFGCTVNGNVNLVDFGTYANNVSVVDATINGTLNVPVGHRVYLQGSPKITNLSVSDGATVITSGMKEGADIGVTATGYFTGVYNNLAEYTDYFSAVSAKEGVFVRNNKLYCGKDYVSNLDVTIDEAAGTHTAYCPACERNVTWTVLTQDVMDAHTGGTSYFYTFNGKSDSGDTHYYLGSDLEYTGTVTYSFLRLPDSGTACLHLNGHNITSTKRSVFYTNSSTINIMGTGTIAGAGKSSSYGAAVHSNNKSAVFNFYSGTYAAADGHPADGSVIRAGGVGARFFFYDDAVIEGAGAANAVYLSTNPTSASELGLHGTVVNGDIIANGRGTGKSWELTLSGATVNGTLTAKDTNTIVLLDDVKIDLLDVSENSKVTLDDGLDDGLSIGEGAFVMVKNAGSFALEYENAMDYVSCFRAAWRDDKIICRDDVLIYKPNYEMGLQLDGSNAARCPVCQKNVTWTAVTDETASVKFTNGGHYYLSKDLTFDADSEQGAYLISGDTGTTTCLHLNGHTITSEQEAAIAVSNGVINVMGEGTVLGASENTNGGCAVLANNATAANGANLYSGTYKKYNAESDKPVISIKENGGNITVYEDAIVDAEGGVAIYTGTAAEGTSNLTLDNVAVNGDVTIAGESDQAVFNTYHSTINGTVSVSGTNDITFSGETNITGNLVIADGSLVGFADMLPPDANIVVEATGTFTTELDNARAWVSYFALADAAGKWVIPRDNALFVGEQVEVTTAEQADIDALLLAYGADLKAKYGEMHNHTSSGLTADGRNTITEWRERMPLLNMSFANIVDHKQVAHMYHDDWQSAPTDEYDVVFVGGSEPATTIQDLSSSATQASMHYNMLVNDPVKLLEIVGSFSKFNLRSKAYNEANWGPNANTAGEAGKMNKNKDFDWTQYSKDADGLLETWTYAKFNRSEFEELATKIYQANGLMVHVHPKYASYIVSDNPLDYFYGGNAGDADATAMGIEIHTGNYGYKPSQASNEKAYQLWLDLLDADKKAYATYGDDSHRLPTAEALSTVYAPDGADAEYYLDLMHDGNFAPGWVGVRMQVGDAVMGGTATTFEGQRLVFSIGDMYQANDYSRIYRDKSQKEQVMDWEPGYCADHEYVLEVYDDGGLLMRSNVDPGQMNYFAIDADPSAKFYRIVVWDMTQGYRCAVGNPIWNAAAYATAE